MIISKMALSRRTVLRGLGAAIALPLLDAMVPALTAAQKTAATPALRMGFYYVPNGMYTPNFFPKGVGTDFEITPILGPLEPFRKQMVVVSGLASLNAESSDGGGQHTRASAVWLNGMRPKRTEGADIQAGMTVDQHAARYLSKDTQLLSLELATEPNYMVGTCSTGYSCAYVNTFAWRTPTTPLPMENNPRVVFERLFGEGGDAEARRAQMQKDRSILDGVNEEIAALRQSLGAQDRNAVSEYFDAIREVERRIEKAEQHAASVPTVEQPLGIPTSYEEHLDLMYSLQRLAFQADITRVVNFQVAREQSVRTYPQIGVPGAHHDMSHHQRNPERIAANTKINIHQMSFFAKFVESLRNTPDGDGTLLDHVVLMYGAGLGDGDLHEPHNLPTVVVGGGGGKLRGGRHIQAKYDTPLMNLGVSLLDLVGVPDDSVGDSTGRLTEI
jgi:hypothetical protein